jgi:DNA-binding CsgD family transcriptional regulator
MVLFPLEAPSVGVAPVPTLLDSTRLLFDLQHVNEVVQAISGCLEPEAIAASVTEALVQQFNCVFARLWLVEPDQQALRLVSSSGLYTHTNGSFARVPMGAYKVGKIAQNRVPFLSNNLADEPWVKDRAWAIANHIRGFAGYPLLAGDRVIGVLAAFSHQMMAPEFLEVLQVLCMTTTIALDAALQVQRSPQAPPEPEPDRALPTVLSDQLTLVLPSTNLTLVGTEQPLPPTLNHGFLRAVEVLSQLHCNYCRLTYRDQAVALEAIVAMPSLEPQGVNAWIKGQFADVETLAQWLGGSLQVQLGSDRRVVQFWMEVPYPRCPLPETSRDRKKLSEREQEVMALLAEGLRDRDIAQRLYISESTVKFHINNSLTKLNAKNRYQAVYQAAIQGCI